MLTVTVGGSLRNENCARWGVTNFWTWSGSWMSWLDLDFAQAFSNLAAMTRISGVRWSWKA